MNSGGALSGLNVSRAAAVRAHAARSVARTQRATRRRGPVSLPHGVRASWLLIDGNYLCHAAFHALPTALAWDGENTGVIYGVLRQVTALLSDLRAERVGWYWDAPPYHRRKVFSGYKAARRDAIARESPAERVARDALYRQADLLRTDIIPDMMGMVSVSDEGYEADDLIATWAARAQVNAGTSVVMVSADHDLYQCLMDGVVMMYKPTSRSLYTAADFEKEYRLPPARWPWIKALAGCSSDNIPGLPGVGEATAAAWLRGELPAGKRRSVIEEGLRETLKRNLPLVRLPWPGAARMPWPGKFGGEPAAVDAVTFGAALRRVAQRYGFESLMERELI